MTLTLSTIFLCFTSCEPTICCTNHEIEEVLFSLQTKDGRSLIDPNTPNYINLENVRKYYVIDGNKSLYYESNLDNPYGIPSKYNVVDNKDYLLVRLNNDESKNGLARTIIQWNDILSDTVDVKVIRNNHSISYRKIIVNGKEVNSNKIDLVKDY